MDMKRGCRAAITVVAMWLAWAGVGAAAKTETPAKVPITTSSAEARAEYLLGRDLVEKLRATDARSHYVRAAELDPSFALAQLGLANTAATANEFFSALRRAVSLADTASDGEAFMIRAFEAGVNGQPEVARAQLTALVAAFPDDERAHNLLGNFHFGRQEWQAAIDEFQRATTINPKFSQPYNQLGYALRFLGRFDEAEKVFKKYSRLLPGEPNPYDSYAELLMKMGRFTDSIAQYEKALEVDPSFVASYVGIANNQMLMGHAEAARAALARLDAVARNDGERRQVCTWSAVSYIHQGNTSKALDEVGRCYDLAKQSNNRVAMSGDLNFMGNILLDAGATKEALEQFEASVATIDRAETTAEVKEAAHRNHLFDRARVEVARGNTNTADALAADYRRLVEARGIPFEVWQTHELAGLIALARGEAAAAAAELDQANQQNPRVLYLLGLAHEAEGDPAAASEAFRRAAEFNGLNLNYAYVRGRALAKLASGRTSPPAKG